MYEEFHKYVYDGPVMFFDKQKARSNLAYQAKTKLKLIAGTKVTLPGKIKMVN